MKVLGLDPGSQRLGYGVLERTPGSWRRLDSGTIKLSVKLPMPERLYQIHTFVSSLIGSHAPDLVAVEECFVAHSPRVALVLGQVRGVLLLAVQQAGIACVELAPRSVKLAVVGFGAASKEQIQAMVPRLCSDCPPHLGPDEADALAIAWSGAAHAETSRRLAGVP